MDIVTKTYKNAAKVQPYGNVTAEFEVSSKDMFLMPNEKPLHEASNLAVSFRSNMNLQSGAHPLNPVAKPGRFLVMQLQILNDYHYSFL